jgi:CBS domain-containing protein
MSWNVGGVMTKDVVTVDPRTSFKTCVRLMRMHGVGALPVLAEGKLAGIVTMTDLMLKEFRPTVRERYEHPEQTESGLTAATLMTPNAITVGPDAPLVVAVRQMFQHRINRLPVVDASGRLVGLISRSDILRVFLRSDISIRREVTDGVLTDLPLIGQGHVTPQVRDGVVTLEGEVESGTLTEVLLRLVASVPGVVGVHNHLKVKPHRRALAQTRRSESRLAGA